MRALKSLAALSLIPIFAACGPVKLVDPNDRNTKVGEETVVDMGGSGLKYSGGMVQGTGAFRGPKASSDLTASYTLSFKLSDTSGVTLVSHGSSELVGGIEIEFSKEAGSNVLKSVFRSGYIQQDKTIEFRAFDANDVITLDIEIDNGVNGDAGVRVTQVNDNGTRRVVAGASPGLPAGGNYGYWGVKMLNALVFQADRHE